MLGSGSKFFIKVASTFVEVPGVQSVQEPDRTRAAVPASTLADTWGTSEAGRPQLGTCTVAIKYTTYAEYLELVDAFNLSTGEYRVERTDGSEMTFFGDFTGLSNGTLERDGLFVTTATITGKGAPTDTAP